MSKTNKKTTKNKKPTLKNKKTTSKKKSSTILSPIQTQNQQFKSNTIISTNENGKINKEFKEFELNYENNGKKANINFYENINGKEKFKHVNLTKADLYSMLNVPSINMDLEKRLENDFLF